IIPALGDRPGSFELRYFGEDAYLTQGLQPYADILTGNLGKVYTIAPVFRAEKTSTHRHLAEYWRIEAAVPSCSLGSLIQTEEQLVCHISNSLSEDAKEELNLLGRSVGDLRRIRSPFTRLTYDEVVEMLQEGGYDVQWGATLQWEHEEYLSLRFRQPFFISEFPAGLETYFYESHPDKAGSTLSVDLLAPEGYGEISSGGIPTREIEKLQRMMEEVDVSPAEQEWYARLKEMGHTLSAGLALGVERITQWICRLEDIREASAFPRSINEIYP
ncbi:MAG: asparagine--tRNA ligase, partial [Candidatus Bathyarchaeota archaeon]|nr:asparagine--tRNA ligase [Candidatus Bathyarchaeota archaeon]